MNSQYTVTSAGHDALVFPQALESDFGVRVGPHANALIAHSDFSGVPGFSASVCLIGSVMIAERNFVTGEVWWKGFLRGLRPVDAKTTRLAILGLVTGRLPVSSNVSQFVFVSEPEVEGFESGEIRYLLVLSKIRGVWHLYGYHDKPDFIWYQGCAFVFGAR